MDLDLLSLSLKDMQESWEGVRGRQAFPRSTMEEREGKNVLKGLGNHWGRRPLKKVPKNLPVRQCREAALGAALAGLEGT